MSSKTETVGNDPTIMGNEKPRRDPEGKKGAGAHQEGPGSKQTGQSDRMSKSGRLEPGDLRPKHEDDNEIDNGGQQTVQGKQRGPDDKEANQSGSKPSGNKPRAK